MNFLYSKEIKQYNVKNKKIIKKNELNSILPLTIGENFKTFDPIIAEEITKKGSEILNSLVESREERREKNRIALRDYWENLVKFTVETDVPTLPKVDKEEWLDFYVPRLIKSGAIPKSELIDGVFYYGNYRNNDVAKWNTQKQKFDVIRYKFGYRWDECNHFEDDDGFALFTPIRLATQEEIDNELLNSIGI